MLSAFRFFCSGVSSFWNLRSYRESDRRKSRNRQTESSCREGAMKKALLYSLFVLVFISGCGANSAPAPIAVTLSTGATQALDQGQSVAITATVANDSTAKGVTWSLASGGQGTIASPTTTAVTYNAGSASGTAVITATSVTDTTKISTLTITVTAPPAITTTTLPPGVEGTAYSQAIAKTGGAGTVTFSISAGTLPAGLTLSSTGTISGTPTGPNGTVNFTVKVTDSSTMTPMTATQALSILVNLPPAPAITTTSLPPGVAGTAYSQPVVATGFGTLTFTISAGTLPQGLMLSGGLISGTPTAPNVTANFTVMVTDSSNPVQTATQALSILINLPPPPTITSLSQNAGAVGASITIIGTNFGTPQGTSTVTFNGTTAAAASAWSATSITVLVPVGATTGNVVVNVLGTASNGSPFTVAPTITSLSQTSGAVGASIAITGTNFGTTQGASTVTFNGTTATAASAWSPTSITVSVPAGATTGNVVVTVLGTASNGSAFTVMASCTTNCSLSGTVTGPWVANVTISLTGTASASTTTAANGTYSFVNLAAGSYTITPTLAGYNYTPTPPTIAINSNTVQNFVAASSSVTTSYSISGTVSGSSTSGIVYIRVFTNGSNTQAGTTLASISTNSGSYTVRGLPPGNNYMVSAEIDTLNTGAQNESNPRGSTPSPITITNANVTGANIIIAPQTIEAPVTPDKPSVFQASGAAFISYKQPRNSTTNEEIATSYRIYYDTNSTFTNNTFKSLPAGDSNNVYVLSGLTNGIPYWFKMSALNVNGESIVLPASVVGPVTINPTSGSNTVSGSVTFTGITPPAGSALYVGMFSDTNGVYFERIANPSISQAYSVSGILTGTYQQFAVLDVAGTGFVGVGDVTNFGSNGPPSLAVNTSISGSNITLAAVSAKTFVATNHQRSASPDTYGIALSTDVGTKRPVSMTLFSGNNVAVPFDMTAERNNSYNPIFDNSVRPLSTDTYQFLVTFSDGTTQVMSNTGLTVLDSFAQTLAMNTPVNSTSLTPLTVPMLNWSAPASPPAFYNYSVGLNNINNAQENWNYNGGNNSNGIPSTLLNVMFNVDGSANPSPTLTTGTMYSWWVQVRDDNGNQAQFQTTYIP